MNILGKDFLTEDEAAHYCCLSKSKFRADVSGKVSARDVHGKKVYRLDELRGFMERAPLWQRSQKGAKAGNLTGAKVDISTVAHLVPYPKKKRKRS